MGRPLQFDFLHVSRAQRHHAAFSERDITLHASNGHSPVPAGSLAGLDALLSDEERAIRDTTRRFADEHLKPNIGRWFDEGVLPRDLAVEFGNLGLLGMHLDGYDCPGLNATSYGLACMELEAADSGIRSFVSVQGSLAMYSIHRYGSQEQKQQWLPAMAAGRAIGCFGLTEPDFGSNPAGMRTHAKRNGTDWILNGSKMWITNGEIADVAVVWAQTSEGIRGFLAPKGTRGFTTTAIKNKLSMRASVTSGLSFDDVRLPADAVLPGALGLSGPLRALNEARFGIINGVVGAARDCIETAQEYALSRVQFTGPIAGYQLTQKKLADMTVELIKAQLLALHLGRAKDAGTLTPVLVSVGKLNNVREALKIARTCRTILGGSGITTEYSPLRHAGNLESVLTYEGTVEVHTLTVGRALTGINAFT
ncbi:acyl-CoA dehydrogenase domain-containing protein [Mycobacterium tuberculosis]|nr:acyl-CoA dehydrogenase domain-containing protein [Mycobacterium tuberculosis]